MNDIQNKIAIIILAAGLGTRMKSDKAKVLHTLCEKPMIQYIVQTAAHIAGENVIVVVGHQSEIVRKLVSEVAKTTFAYQEKQLGTGHAVKCALPYVPEHISTVIILNGDVPLISVKTIHHLASEHLTENRDISILVAEVKDPMGYGRIIFDTNNNIQEIVEEADANESQKQINHINAGIYCVNKNFLAYALENIRSDNQQKELYLTDIIGIASREDRSIRASFVEEPEEISGVNTPEDLNRIESMLRSRIGKKS